VLRDAVHPGQVGRAATQHLPAQCIKGMQGSAGCS
jgi:hypothetical protein